jgi:hypothetical protein
MTTLIAVRGTDLHRRPLAARILQPGALLVLGVLLALGAGLMLLPATASAQLLTEEDLAKIPAGSQPIKFSHKIHAGDNQIQCQYCHVYARRSRTSGVPAVAVCMGCHRFVNPGLSEVQKLAKFWENKEPIPWVKIHDIPDFVRYNHARHVNAKNEMYPNGIQCQTCHGPIETMHVVEKYNPNFGLMGWCLDCHLKVPGTLEQKRGTPEALGSMRLMHAKHPSGNYVRPKLTDCLTCHY